MGARTRQEAHPKEIDTAKKVKKMPAIGKPMSRRGRQRKGQERVGRGLRETACQARERASFAVDFVRGISSEAVKLVGGGLEGLEEKVDGEATRESHEDQSASSPDRRVVSYLLPSSSPTKTFFDPKASPGNYSWSTKYAFTAGSRTRIVRKPETLPRVLT